MDSLQADGYEHTVNYLVHIYVTYANSVIQDWVSKNKRTTISRARIEKDITRLIHQNEDLSLQFKIACTSMILHTNMFDSFWYGCKMSAGLSSRSIKRMTPDYDLVNEVPCPSSAATTTSSPLPTPSTSSNGDSGSVAGDEAPRGKKTATTKKNGTTKRAPPKRKAPAKPRAKRAQPKTKAAAAAAPLLKDVAKPTGVVKNIAPPKETTPLPPLRRTNRPIGPTGREAYEMSMARHAEEPYTLGGPTSGSDSSPDDDESDSDEEMTGANPIRK